MLSKKILKHILNVKYTVIEKVELKEADGSPMIRARVTKGASCRCGICGTKAPLYDQGRGARVAGMRLE